MIKQVSILAPLILLGTWISSPEWANAQEWTSAQQELWKLEESYIGHLKDGNFEDMGALYDADFVGWPSYASEPLDRANGKASLEEIYEKAKIKWYELHPKAIVIHDHVAIVHYLAEIMLEDSEGKEEVDSTRITHTWLNEGKGWKIIGGMSAH